MSVNRPQYPAWDGSSPTRDSRLIDAAPSSEDWDQIVAEVLAAQGTLQQAAIDDLTDSTGGTTDGDLEAMDGVSSASNAATGNDNFAELNVKVDAILAALRAANIILP